MLKVEATVLVPVLLKALQPGALSSATWRAF